MKNTSKISSYKIQSIRESVNSLTDETIKQLNKINHILTEIEKELTKHPH